jgi:hypothetical protein
VLKVVNIWNVKDARAVKGLLYAVQSTLQQLKVYGCTKLLPENCLQGLQFPCMQKLVLENSLGDTAVAVFVVNCPNLECLVLHDDAALYTTTLRLCAPCTPKMRHFAMRRTGKVRIDHIAQGLSAAFSNWSQLEIVDVENSNLSNGLVAALVGKNKELYALRFSRCDGLHDSCLRHIALRCGERLRCLDVSGCQGISPAGLICIANSCTALECLCLRDFHCAVAEIAPSIRGLTMLRWLDVRENFWARELYTKYSDCLTTVRHLAITLFPKEHVDKLVATARGLSRLLSLRVDATDGSFLPVALRLLRLLIPTVRITKRRGKSQFWREFHQSDRRYSQVSSQSSIICSEVNDFLVGACHVCGA